MPPSPYLAANYGTPPNPTQQTAQPLGGQLPFQMGGNPFSQDLGSAYQSSYKSALDLNQSNYSNILQGYQQALGQQTSAQDAIGKGYGQLYSQVLGGIQGIGQSQAQAIADAYSQQSGQAQQDLINRGLGNSTVLSSVQRGIGLDKSKADTALANQIAQLTAGYQSQLGGQGLNYANQAAMQNTALQNQQLQWMNSVNAPYPNAQMYANIAQQQGAVSQADQDRALAREQFDKVQQVAQAAQGRSGGGGSLPPSYLPAPNLGPMNTGGGGYAGQMASVTPFGMGGVNSGGLGAAGGGTLNPNFSSSQGGTGNWFNNALGAAGLPSWQQMQANYEAPGDTQWQQGAYGMQNAAPVSDWSQQGWQDYVGGYGGYDEAGAY